MSIENDIYLALFDLFESILGAPFEIVQAYQDTPAPKEKHITIGLPRMGEEGQESEFEDLDNGKVNFTLDYTGFVDIWQTGGDGSELRSVLGNLNNRDSKTLLEEKKLVVISSQEINFLPRMKDKNWVREWQTELRIAFAINYEETGHFAIETVQYVNNIQK